MRISAHELSFSYTPERTALDRVSLAIEPGRLMLLFGPNGCGKSTLLRCLNGGLPVRPGTVQLGGLPVAGMPPDEVARQISVVPQDTPADVPFTVREVLAMGRYAFGDADTAETRHRAEEAMQGLQLSALLDRRFDALSGGERQMVVLARAVARDTPVYLFDEPTAHLDIGHQLAVLEMARALARRGKTVCVVSHDILLAPMFADVCVLMANGRIVCQGGAPEVLSEDQLRCVYGCRLHLERVDDETLMVHRRRG